MNTLVGQDSGSWRTEVSHNWAERIEEEGREDGVEPSDTSSGSELTDSSLGADSKQEHSDEESCKFSRFVTGCCGPRELERELVKRNIKTGSLVLVGVIVASTIMELLMGAYVAITDPGDLLALIRAVGWRSGALHFSGELLGLLLLIWSLKRPRLSTYFPTMAFFFAYHALVVLFVPMQVLASLDDLEFDKDSVGYIGLDGNMWLIFLTPLVVPERRFMWTFGLSWLASFFAVMAVCIGWLPPTNPYSKASTFRHDALRYRCNFDLAVSVLFLSAGFLLVTARKRMMEEEQLTNYRLDVQKKGVTEHMLRILNCAVPSFAIIPLLKGESIAFNVDRASVLFMQFADFDIIVRQTTSPGDLLEFLNRYFTEIDQICASHGVTKIETVGEVYVCAVGIVPEDRSTDSSQGHRILLGRLVGVALRVLQLSSAEEQVSFQMGIHTGPVVAGVVGQRLPRFRLFGDTINTAARMMQKGLPGQVQFGEATESQLPSWVRRHQRGQVEMKGKGLMATYLLTRARPAVQPTAVQATVSEEPSVGGAHMRHGLTQMLLDCTAHRGARGAHELGAQTLSFDQALDELGLDAFMGQRMERRRRLPTASGVVWAARSAVVNEGDYRKWYHETCFCHNIVPRMRRLTKSFTIICFFELMYLLANKEAFEELPDIEVIRRNFLVFILCRIASVAILVSWLVTVHCCAWVKEAAVFTQRCLLSFWCVLVGLVFTSYDCLPLLFDSISDEVLFPLQGISKNVIFLDCFPMVMFIMMAHPFTFVQSLAFPFITVTLVTLEQFNPYEDCILSNLLIKCIFVISSMVCPLFAYLQEANFRDRHRNQTAVLGMLSKVENILDTLLPPMVVRRLRQNPTEAKPQHRYRHATVVQADLVGFTQLASLRTPTEVVQIISDIFGLFDKLADEHGVYKVETVGDAYIAAQAEEPLTSLNSPLGVVLFGLGMVEATHTWAHEHGEDLSCRVGVHSGECVGGIVGNDMQRYHLFGSLMASLELLESTSLRGKVQVSSACKRAVEKSAQELQRVAFEMRTESQLSSSKGETHSFDEVGGVTFLVRRVR